MIRRSSKDIYLSADKRNKINFVVLLIHVMALGESYYTERFTYDSKYVFFFYEE